MRARVYLGLEMMRALPGRLVRQWMAADKEPSGEEAGSENRAWAIKFPYENNTLSTHQFQLFTPHSSWFPGAECRPEARRLQGVLGVY